MPLLHAARNNLIRGLMRRNMAAHMRPPCSFVQHMLAGGRIPNGTSPKEFLYQSFCEDVSAQRAVNNTIPKHPVSGVSRKVRVVTFNVHYFQAGYSAVDKGDTQDEVMEVLARGDATRAVASTNMNQKSSRSHSVFVMHLLAKTPEGGTKAGKLNLVDLAGSEKISKTGATGETLEEAKKINQSLSALGNVVAALTDPKGRPHIPFRDSKSLRKVEMRLFLGNLV